MAKQKVTKRVALNRATLTALGLGLANGLDELGASIIEETRPHAPDQPPLGRGLVASGGHVVTVNGKKVAGDRSMPRAAASKAGIVLVAGWGFPARFNERGTIHQPARPFFAPRWYAGMKRLTETLRKHAQSAVDGAA